MAVVVVTRLHPGTAVQRGEETDEQGATDVGALADLGKEMGMGTETGLEQP